MKAKLALLLPVLGLGGCAAASYCAGVQDYQRAASLPPVQPADELRVPQSESALRIPPPPANPVPYGRLEKDEDGDDVVRCLDKPPALPPLVLPPEPAKPAEPKAEEKAPS